MRRFAIALVLLSCRSAPPPSFDQGDNAVWATRHWLHGNGAKEITLAELRARGVTTLYPFLGPPNAEGRPGWRDRGEIRAYDDARVRAFLSAPRDVDVIPWTGGVLHHDVHPADPAMRRRFVAHLAKIVALGADGVQLNVEPLPSWEPGYLDLLRETKLAIGSNAKLSVAAYPPETPLHPFTDVHWSLAFTREVCSIADEIAVMGYDTALGSPDAYRKLMSDWTAQLAETLRDAPCTWRMGVPAYEDDEPWHRPDAERLDVALLGVRDGLARTPAPNFRGVAIYATWTLDADEWRNYNRRWRENFHPED